MAWEPLAAHRRTSAAARSASQSGIKRQRHQPGRSLGPAPLVDHPVVVGLHAEQRDVLVLAVQEDLTAEAAHVGEADRHVGVVAVHRGETGVALVGAGKHLVVGDRPACLFIVVPGLGQPSLQRAGPCRRSTRRRPTVQSSPPDDHRPVAELLPGRLSRGGRVGLDLVTCRGRRDHHMSGGSRTWSSTEINRGNEVMRKTAAVQTVTRSAIACWRASRSSRATSSTTDIDLIRLATDLLGQSIESAVLEHLR